MNRTFKKGETVLFYGDSITDCGRIYEDNNSLGEGYPKKIKQVYDTLFADNNVNFYNKGISGNRIGDLLDRYEKDVLSLKPDYISIFIGVNDTWRRYDENDPTEPEVFMEKYKELLERIRKDLPDCKIMMMEPFLLDSDPEKNIMWEDLTPKVEVIKNLGSEYADFYMNVGRVFEKALSEGEINTELVPDGVHPSDLGHGYIAEVWLKILKVI